MVTSPSKLSTSAVNIEVPRDEKGNLDFRFYPERISIDQLQYISETMFNVSLLVKIVDIHPNSRVEINGKYMNTQTEPNY